MDFVIYNKISIKYYVVLMEIEIVDIQMQFYNVNMYNVK